MDNALITMAHEVPCSAHIESSAIEAIAGKNGVQFDEVGVPYCYIDDGGLPHCLCKGLVGALCIQSQHLEGTGCNACENQDIESDPDDSSSQSSEEWTDEVITKDPMHYALRCLLAENASQMHFKTISMDQRDFLFDFFNSCCLLRVVDPLRCFVKNSRMIHDAGSGILLLIWLAVLLAGENCEYMAMRPELTLAFSDRSALSANRTELRPRGTVLISRGRTAFCIPYGRSGRSVVKPELSFQCETVDPIKTPRHQQEVLNSKASQQDEIGDPLYQQPGLSQCLLWFYHHIQGRDKQCMIGWNNTGILISSHWELIQDPGFTKANHSKSVGQLHQSPITQQQLPTAASLPCNETLLCRRNQPKHQHHLKDIQHLGTVSKITSRSQGINRAHNQGSAMNYYKRHAQKENRSKAPALSSPKGDSFKCFHQLATNSHTIMELMHQQQLLIPDETTPAKKEIKHQCQNQNRRHQHRFAASAIQTIQLHNRINCIPAFTGRVSSNISLPQDRTKTHPQHFKQNYRRKSEIPHIRGQQGE
ncbi:hypothetical protein Nepgr_014767 [Nepenthes gracilis]|uniref:Uncharacterized protein n=1 Tax=Nepenthes gracilis TaxID=150966 RepID=A0AAD3SMG3_NEPGR|nr:hypothetical protein Nepgr_014767 [Nepenthes gracilis]